MLLTSVVRRSLADVRSMCGYGSLTVRQSRYISTTATAPIMFSQKKTRSNIFASLCDLITNIDVEEN